MDRANNKRSITCWQDAPEIKVWEGHLGSPSLHVQFELRIVRKRTRSSSVPFHTPAMPDMKESPIRNYWRTM